MIGVTPEQFLEKIKKLEERLKEAENVLVFYANKENWIESNDPYYPTHTTITTGDWETDEYGGKRAREYFKK